jgi:hypothetical protein
MPGRPSNTPEKDETGSAIAVLALVGRISLHPRPTGFSRLAPRPLPRVQTNLSNPPQSKPNGTGPAPASRRRAGWPGGNMGWIGKGAWGARLPWWRGRDMVAGVGQESVSPTCGPLNRMMYIIPPPLGLLQFSERFSVPRGWLANIVRRGSSAVNARSTFSAWKHCFKTTGSIVQQITDNLQTSA